MSLKSTGVLVVAGLTMGAIALGAAPAAPPAETVTLNASIRHQTMRGWGGSLSFLRDMNYVSQATIDQMVDELVNDLGLTFLRIGFSKLSEPFNDDGNSNSFNWNGFYDQAVVDREVARGLGRFATLVRANGDPLTLLFNTDWENSAPSWMNDNEFSEHMTATMLYFRNQHGLTVDFSSVDNEPDFHDPYTPERQRSIIKAMGPKFQANGLPTKVALNEGINAESTWRYITAMQGDAAVWPHIGLLNWHLYGAVDPFRSQIRDFGAARGIPTAMTEFSGAEVGHLMADLTLGGVSYWHRYHLADAGAAAAGGGANYLAAPIDGTSFLRNHTYYQFRQFMKYVRPGAVRIEATSTNPGLRAFAFERGSSRVVVLVSVGIAASDVTVQGMAAGRYGVSQTLGQTYSEMGVQDIGSTITVHVPNNGIVTVYPAPSNQSPQPKTWAAAPSFVTLPASSVSLTASAEDTEREALTFTWSVKSAPAGASVSLGSTTGPATSATGLTVAGTYVFTVVFRDASNQTATRDVTVRAYQGNQPPVIAEGHRYFKQEWMVPPASSATFGPLFITAHDIDGDPITTSFSVVSQPSGANAVFNGNTVNGMNREGTYVFRFTASDPTHTVTRDFTRRVLSSAPSTPEPPPGTGRRRPPGVESIGTAVPRGSAGGDGANSAPRPATAAVATATGKGAASRSPIVDWVAALAENLASAADALAVPRLDWRRIETIDVDEDGFVDLLQIELQTGEILNWTVGRVRRNENSRK